MKNIIGNPDPGERKFDQRVEVRLIDLESHRPPGKKTDSIRIDNNYASLRENEKELPKTPVPVKDDTCSNSSSRGRPSIPMESKSNSSRRSRNMRSSLKLQRDVKHFNTQAGTKEKQVGAGTGNLRAQVTDQNQLRAMTMKPDPVDRTLNKL